jgi:hypothetical protein
MKQTGHWLSNGSRSDTMQGGSLSFAFVGSAMNTGDYQDYIPIMYILLSGQNKVCPRF